MRMKSAFQLHTSYGTRELEYSVGEDELAFCLVGLPDEKTHNFQ